MERETRVLEGQAEMFEEPADFPFGIGDQLLVNDAVYAARQNGIEMCHRFRIVGIGAAQFRITQRPYQRYEPARKP